FGDGVSYCSLRSVLSFEGRPEMEERQVPMVTAVRDRRWVTTNRSGRWSTSHFLSLWCVLSVIYAAILTWSPRYAMNAAGLSYLDIASEALRAGPFALVNGLWSPGYPALIALTLGVTHPNAKWEIPAVHLLNFACFLFALWAFRAFVIDFLSLRRPVGRPNHF